MTDPSLGNTSSTTDRVVRAHRRALRLVAALDAVWLKRSVASWSVRIAVDRPPRECPACEERVQPIVRPGDARAGALLERCPQCETLLSGR